VGRQERQSWRPRQSLEIALPTKQRPVTGKINDSCRGKKFPIPRDFFVAGYALQAEQSLTHLRHILFSRLD
jgi:hypothetical protein